ncbi:PREDICTED: branched-chain-amino-acid aminotransferase 6 isoform X1 [Theobroma cacao]|uniref:Branched-chain-amino-acid aminotransferase n=1 Tax=Theobroma cacao TaxID=3641 RepID=A0AB32VGM9_THECC|nr:PREDICTED: branched-chain-amino-acid aminotransferase 6 isoform X1 [Theobroma cacao]
MNLQVILQKIHIIDFQVFLIARRVSRSFLKLNMFLSRQAMFGLSICARNVNQLSRIESLLSKPKLRSYARPVTTALENYESSIYSSGKTEYANVNWDELGFALTKTDYMYVMNCSKDEEIFSEGILTRFGNIELCPSSGILNYGQGLFEGLKAYRKEDDGILLFRPEENALRMKMGADRMCMPSPTVEQFIDAVKRTVLANKRWVPPHGRGALYIRPLLMGTGPNLGVKPASEYTFLAYASPVGNYHKSPMNLVVEDKVCRAAPGGTGGVKAVTNYSPIYKTLGQAKARGFTDVLFLDALTGRNIEEGSAFNIFVLKGNVISTPTAHGTILPGITRKSIIEIASTLGYQVEERDVPIEEVFDAEEVFCTGTAMVLKSVVSITYQGKRIEYKMGEEPVAQKLHATLTGIQTGLIEDKMGWTVEVD